MTDDQNALVLGAGNGFALVDIEPESPGRGSPTMVWLRPQRAALQLSFMWPPLEDDLASGVVPGSGLWSITATSARSRTASLALVDPTVNLPPKRELLAQNFYRQTTARRLAIGTLGLPLDVVDLVSGRRAVPPLPPTTPAFAHAAADPTRSRFSATSGEPGNYEITIYELDAAPLD